MSLTDREIKSAESREKTYRLSDEKGLYVEITTKGQKYWRLKYRFAGKEKRLAFGVYPEVTLKNARAKRENARALLANSIDPAEHKKAQKAAESLSASNSFKAVALEWFNTKLSDKTEGHRRRVKRALEAHLFPHIGNTRISELTAPALLDALRQLEKADKVETAHRSRQIVGQIFRYAIATGRADRDPAADLRGALKTPQKRHFAAITEPKDAGRLMLAIDTFTGTPTVKAALKLQAMFFCRPGELRHLKWSAVNLEENRIELIADKTKTPHIIPLSKQTHTILEELHRLTGNGEYIFPSARGRSRPMSENALRVALRSMGYTNEQMTPHGFRAMARTLLDEVLGFRVEWIEQQLAHSVKDANGRAYNRTKHLEQRAQMMQEWADYLDQLKAAAQAGNVVSANFGRGKG